MKVEIRRFDPRFQVKNDGFPSPKSVSPWAASSTIWFKYSVENHPDAVAARVWMAIMEMSIGHTEERIPVSGDNMEGVAMSNSENPIKPLTVIGKLRKGVTKNDKFKDAVPLINDIFSRAWEERLDMFVICRGLSDEKNQLFENITGHSFSDLIDLLVKRGSNVCLLLWTTDEAELDLPPIVELKNRVRSYTGRLEVRVSYSDEKFGHLLIAASPKDDRWLLRVEKSHGQSTYHPDFDVPAAVFFDNDVARDYAKHALSQFGFFFGQSDLIPQEFWPEPSDGFGRDSSSIREPEFAH